MSISAAAFSATSSSPPNSAKRSSRSAGSNRLICECTWASSRFSAALSTFFFSLVTFSAAFFLSASATIAAARVCRAANCAFKSLSILILMWGCLLCFPVRSSRRKLSSELVAEKAGLQFFAPLARFGNFLLFLLFCESPGEFPKSSRKIVQSASSFIYCLLFFPLIHFLTDNHWLAIRNRQRVAMATK